MTIDRNQKKSVRFFADLNQISYTTSLRAHEEGIPDFSAFVPAFARTESQRRLYTDITNDEQDWAGARGLELTIDHPCFCRLGNETGLISKSGPERQRHRTGVPADCATDTGGYQDHARRYLFKGEGDARKRFAAVTFAPYLTWNDPDVTFPVIEAAERHDLEFRIGMPDDDTYGAGTVPIVMWNPRVIDLK